MNHAIAVINMRNFIAIPVGPPSTYIIVKKGAVIRTAKCLGAEEAKRTLKPKPKRGEGLYIKVGRD